MPESLIFRQFLRSPEAFASRSIDFFTQQRCKASNLAAAATANEETHRLKQNNPKGKWVNLPPFTSSVDSNSLGKRLYRRNLDEVNDSIDTTRTALKWVLHCCPGIPRSLVQKLFRLRQVRKECLEGDSCRGAQNFLLKKVGAKDLLNDGDKILLPITVKASQNIKKHEYKCSEEEFNLVRGLELYKDSAIIAINKPPNLPVQGGHGIIKSFDVLAARCLKYDYKDPPRLVHRLDRDCSGILVMGRTLTSTAVLHSIFREKTVSISDKEIDWGKRALQKRYLALVFGVPKQLHGLISAPLAKVVLGDGKSERIIVMENSSSSQHAVTEYRVIETSTYGYTWLELLPVTGRKHQLRVHCAEVLGTPIVGDYKYGWQAHRKWEPFPSTKLDTDEKFVETNLHHLGFDLELGCIAEKEPHLHLHCKQMILPNISKALEHDSTYDFSKLDSLSLVASLPQHMQRSWNLLKSC